MNKPVIVAIDGPGGSGKSTAAKKVAERLGFVHINTGAMYRSVALWAMRLQVALDDHLKLSQLAENAQIQFAPGTRAVLLNGEEVTAQLYGEQMDAAASRVSVVPGVRTALVEKMRAMAATDNVVMEGRDIGTVVFPEAGVKVFLDASPEVRAKRRAPKQAWLWARWRPVCRSAMNATKPGPRRPAFAGAGCDVSGLFQPVRGRGGGGDSTPDSPTDGQRERTQLSR